MSFGSFFRYYDEHLLTHSNDPTLGLIGGMQASLVLFFSFLVGRLLDARLHRWVVGLGGILTTLGYFCLSLSTDGDGQGNYGFVILTQGIVAGVGMSCFFQHSSHLAVQVSIRFRSHKFESDKRSGSQAKNTLRLG